MLELGCTAFCDFVLGLAGLRALRVYGLRMAGFRGPVLSD